MTNSLQQEKVFKPWCLLIVLLTIFTVNHSAHTKKIPLYPAGSLFLRE